MLGKILFKSKVTEYILTDGPPGNQIVHGPEEIKADNLKQVMELVKQRFSEDERNIWVTELPFYTRNPSKTYVGYIINIDVRTGRLFSNFDEAQILDDIDDEHFANKMRIISKWSFV